MVVVPDLDLESVRQHEDFQNKFRGDGKGLIGVLDIAYSSLAPGSYSSVRDLHLGSQPLGFAGLESHSDQ